MIKAEALFLIPIKWNSKRLPNKNELVLGRIPLFCHAVRTAITAKRSLIKQEICNNLQIIVSVSNVNKGQELCYNVGLFLNESEWLERPDYLNHDPYQLADIALYVLEQLAHIEFRSLIMIQPSNPFITREDIEECYKIHKENDFSAVRTITLSSSPMHKELIIAESKKLSSPFFYNLNAVNERSIPQTYHSNGGVQVISIEELREYRGLYGNPTYGYIIPQERSIDINTETDFIMAKALMEHQRSCAPLNNNK